MPLRKKVGYYGLRDLSYSIVDTSENSPNFFRIIEFPEKLKAGKNLIKLAANRDNLVNNSEIQIEILDYNGNPIYYEPLRYIEKDGTRVIAIYIYPDTSPGECTIYLAGRVLFDPSTGIEYGYSQNSNDANFYQVPNTLWSRTCNVAPNAANDVEIIFTQYPRVTISEIIQPYLQPVDRFNVFTQVTSSGNAATVTATAVLNNSSTLTGTQAEAVGQIGQGSTSPGTPSFGKQYFNTTGTQTTLSSTTNATTISPILQTLNGYSVITTAQPFFSASMTNGRMTIVNPQISVVSSTAGKSNLIYPGQQFDETTFDYGSGTRSLSGSYEFAITQVINSTTARIAQIAGFADLEYDTLGSFSVQLRKTTSATTSTRAPQSYETYIVNRIEPTSNFTASFIQPTLTIQTENSSSFADIILSNIEPATGDVYRVKTLFKPSGQFGDFIDLGDSILERTDVLIDTQSLETNVTVGAYYENFGIFENLAEINQYWTGSALGTISTANPLTITYNVDTLIGGAKITPTTTAFQTNDAAIFSIKPQYQQQLYAGTEYIIVFNIATAPDITSFTTTNTNIPNPRLDVYISGSAINKQEAFTRVTTGNVESVTNFNATLNGNFQDNGRLGTRIGTYETTNIGGTVATVTFRFIAEEDGPFDLKFVTRRGSFILGEIQVLANKETGFSPNYVRINKRIPTEHLNTPLTFKFQFFNFRGDKADAEAIAYGAIFDGDNTYIDGVNNLITGSIFISDQIGSGMEIAGTNSGFMRSVGYEGFTSASNPAKGGAAGWMIWSGSVLPQSGDNYGGVGLELIADANNYLQYRTYPNSVFIVKAETFFLGSSSQYLSGSSGNIEISSSNFHLTAQGNVTASNALFTGVALANIIRDKTVVITAANSGSYLRTDDFGNITTKTGYRIFLDGTYGGEIVRRIRIACNLLYPIGDFELPNLGSTAKMEVVLENGVTGNQIYDVFTPTRSVITDPAVITLKNNDVMTFVAANTNATDWYCIAGNLQPFGNYAYKRGVIVTGSLELTGSFIVNNNKQFNYGGFSNSSSIANAGANISSSIPYTTVDVDDGVTYTNNSRIQFPNNGIYNIQFSAQLDNTGGADTVYIWIKKNGVNIPATAGAITAANNIKTIVAWNWVYSLLGSDYLEIAWQTTSGHAVISALPASGNVPAIPSIIVTVTQVA